jgi:hypothetical protein|tara:strand:- start:5214 stop:5717 length:504 start_codon:yes stop_codon:yes gene_type:complete
MYRHTFSYYLIEEYIEIKKDVLKKIKQVSLKKDKHNPEMNLNSYYEAMDNTDESIVFKEFINKQLKDIFEKHNLKLKNCWVQKYLKNSYHSLHVHDSDEKSFVWFIEGNEKSSPTVFYDVGFPYINTNQSISFKFIPGTLLIFPGFLPHEVRPNKNNNRLIVSGNVF